MEKTGQKRKRGHETSSGPRIDPTYGQRGFIPGLDGSDSGDEDSMEALTYLRSVRSEASCIPNLLIAPTNKQEASVDTSTRNSFQGFYSDGAYVAYGHEPDKPDEGESLEYDDEESLQTTEAGLVESSVAYHSSLINRFEVFRQQLLQPRPPSTLYSVDSYQHPIVFDADREEHEEETTWYTNLTNTMPSPTQLASIDQGSTLGVLYILSRKTGMRRDLWLTGSGAKGSCMSAWIWGLLARLADVDTLSSEEVSTVRELGKRAATMVIGLDKAPIVEREEEVHDLRGRNVKQDTPPRRRRNSSSSVEADADASSSPKESEIENGDEDGEDGMHDSPCSNDENLTATLDMILTIVGEKYGQRDLLAARDRLWVKT